MADVEDNGKPGMDITALDRLVEGELAGAVTFVDRVTRDSSALRVANRADMQQAAEMMSAIRETRKIVEARWADMFGPIEAHLKKLRARAREYFFDPLDRAYGALAAECVRFDTSEKERVARESAEREKAEAERKANADMLARAGAPPEVIRRFAPPVTLPMPTIHVGPVRGNGGAGVTITKVPTVLVTDKAAIPLEYLEINERAILAAWRAGRKDIPGIEIRMESRARGLS